MGNDLNRSIKIYIDGTEAAQGVKQVETAIQKLEDKLSSLNKSEANYNTRSKQLQKEIEAKNKTLRAYKQKIEETDNVLKNLSGATYNQLIAVQSQVRKQLRDAIPGTQQYTTALEQNKRVTEALARAQSAMRVEVGCHGTVWGKAADFINKYIGLAGAAVAAITGISMKLNQLREQRNKREEAKADVEALTGLDKNSINWLEQQAIQLSNKMTESGVRIRQSATEILDAYKLVGSAKPELLNDKEALAEVTEQTLILASASGMKLKDAVDAVTLSMNQYGAEADQASRYTNVMAAGSKYGSAAVESVTNAITKSGVAASSAGVPIEQLVGTIETLAEKGIKDEIAGTGLKKFFLTLQTGADDTNPKIVGLDMALDNLQKKQLSAAKIKKMFGEEGYNVASVLINEADKVKYYTEAVTGTSVAMEQAAIKSETTAAKLDQAKNKMNEMGIQLMEKLTPSITSVINGTVNWGRRMIDLIGFMVKHSGTIITLTTAIVSYSVVVKALAIYETRLKNAKLLNIATDKMAEFWSKVRLASVLALSAAKFALTGNTKMASEAMQRFNATMKGNLIGIVISLLATVGMAIYQYSKRTKEATTAQEKFSVELLKEQRSLNSLFDALRRSGEGTENRKKLINEVNKVYGQYLPNLLTEKSSLDEINDAYKRINRSLASQIALKVKNAANEEIVSKSIEEQAVALENMRKKLNGAFGNSTLSTIVIEDLKRITGEFQKAGSKWQDAWGQAYHTISVKYFKKQSLGDELGESMEDYIRSVYDMEKKVAQTEAKFKPFINSMTNELPEVTVTGTNPDKNKSNVGDPEESQKAIKKKLDAENIIYAQHQSQLKAFYLEGHDETLQTEKQFNAEMECLQLEHLQRIIKITGAKSKEGADAQNQINDLKMKQRTAEIQQQIENEKLLYERQQEELKSAYVSGKDDNLKTEESYNDAMEQLAIMHLERILQIANLDADQRRSIEKQLLDFKVKCLNDEEKERKKLEDKDQKKKDAAAKRDKQRLDQQAQQYREYGQKIGETLGDMISGQENALQGFADTMLDILFDVLSQMIDIEIAKATGTAVGAVARASAEAFAQPDSVATFGATGAARAAILSGLIMAALATAKSALKGLIHKGSSSSSADSSGTEAPKTAQVQVKQWASGRYDVIGQDDGKTYKNVPYIGPAPTGIVRRTSLVSENGAELIINAEDLARLQHHVNYPVVVQAIEDSRNGHVPQRAAGNYSTVDAYPRNATNPVSEATISAENIDKLLAEIKTLISTLRHLKASVVLRDLHEAEELDAKSKQPFTRSTK